MQNFPKISALIMVVAAVTAIGLSMKMRESRADMLGVSSAREEAHGYVPMLGIDKFYADIKWIQAIQLLGRQRGEMDDTMVSYFMGEFNTISDLDPDFAPLYVDEGLGHIAYYDLDGALALIEKNEKFGNKHHWKTPYYAAHWVLQVRGRDKLQDHEAMKPVYAEAITYLEKAVELESENNWHAQSMLLNTTAKLQGDYDDPYRQVRAWYRYYDKRAKENRVEASSEGEGEMGAEMGQVESEAMQRLRERIVNRCRSLISELLAQKTEAKDDKARQQIDKQMKDVREGIFAKLADTKYFSRVSLLSYEPGDMYDSLTGTPVVPYGIDLYDYEVNNRLSLLKGNYNTLTGKEAAGSFEKLVELLGGEQKIERLKAHYELAKEQGLTK